MRVIVMVSLLASSLAFAQKAPPVKPKPTTPPAEGKLIDITDPLSLKGQLRDPHLLFFLERVDDELQRGTLPKRTFVPRLVQTVDEEKL
ncbi:MAG TPA: hypothetical protein VMJ10_26740 [Kofleriaceae bacterium]|nr:hypothetical protein [Kofleriaceae bacterium]